MLILAGGMGTRLRPLGLTRPKILFPFVDMPLVDYTLRGLSNFFKNPYSRLLGIRGSRIAFRIMLDPGVLVPFLDLSLGYYSL